MLKAANAAVGGRQRPVSGSLSSSTAATTTGSRGAGAPAASSRCSTTPPRCGCPSFSRGKPYSGRDDSREQPPAGWSGATGWIRTGWSRLEGTSEIGRANGFLLETYLPKMNDRFSRPARSGEGVHVHPGKAKLDDILCMEFDRRVSKDLVIRFQARLFRIQKAGTPRRGQGSCPHEAGRLRSYVRKGNPHDIR